MTHNFEVGDLAKVIGRPEEWVPGDLDYVGSIVTIVEPLQLLYNACSGRQCLAHVVDIESEEPFTVVAIEPHNLKPYYDGNEVVSWDEVIDIWEPKILEHVSTPTGTVD